MNPRASFKDPITVDDVMNADMIAYPFTKLMCCLVTDGGGALILTSAERAKDFPQISGELKMAPSEYVKRNCYVTCEADEGDMTQSLKEVGEDHILMATDFPHFDSEYPHTVSGIRERTDLTSKQKDKILGENAAKILNL